MRKLLILITGILISTSALFSQELQFSKSFSWEIKEIQISKYDKKKQLAFDGGQFGGPAADIPVLLFTEAFGSQSEVQASLTNIIAEPLTADEIAALGTADIAPEFSISANTVSDRRKSFVQIELIPLRKTAGRIEKIISCTINVRSSGNFSSPKSAPKSTKTSSVLASGTWYKIGVTSSGMYRITRAQLQAMGMSNPGRVRVYGNGGAQLPERNSDFYPDDLHEVPVYITGDQDGSLDDSDVLLFYAQGPVKWKYEATKDVFRHQKNIYADTAWYFITSGSEPVTRPAFRSQSQAPVQKTITQFDDYQFVENDEENLMRSGRRWFGNRMELINSASFSFEFQNVIPGTGRLISMLVGRNSAPNQATQFRINLNNEQFSQTVPAISRLDYLGPQGRDAEQIFSFSSAGSAFNLTVTRTSSNTIGWVDYLILNVRRQLRFSGSQLAFRDKSSLEAASGAAEYIISNVSSNLKVWDITNIYDIYDQEVSISGSSLSFKTDASELRQFIAFNPNGVFPAPIPGGRVANQNLHGMSQIDMLIITHPLFSEAANRIAAHRRSQDGLKVAVVNIGDIYNEFSSGAQDISAIRNFVRMFYERANGTNDLKYLLLVGDASFDPKYRVDGNSNFIPIYESEDSFNPTSSYGTDDYYGLLDPSEGANIATSSGGMLDIAVGRLPVATADQANALAEKIIRYETSMDAMLDWRNTILLIADDEDSGVHVNQIERIANTISSRYPLYNIDKIYLDAYQQQSSSGGQYYPEVNAAITNRIERGCLITNYVGHGGEESLAHERIVTIPQITSWSNLDNLTFFITATCEFARYDDPTFVSAGEHVILNPKGGAVGMFTTVRLTFSSSNDVLNRNIIDTIFGIADGKRLTVGEIMRIGKNRSGSSYNNRSFALLGDPAMRLAAPALDVRTSSVQVHHPQGLSPADTLRALDMVTISGYVANLDQSVRTSFSGTLYPTVFDKVTNTRTLSNDGSGSPVIDFQIQRNIIFRGPVSVKNGQFSFSFVVPQDIRFEYGPGKISYYARHSSLPEDASGYYKDIIVGGFSSNPITDNQGPLVELFMNNEQFVSGSMTNENPELLAYVEDDIGINTVGTGIGHDITAVLDGNTSQPIVLNDYYQADQDNHRKGTIRYPFRNLAEGPHTLSLKVWDVANNSATATIEFVVVKSDNLQLDKVMNYPNPFTTHTQFFFEHNQPGIPVDVEIQIFTISGKIVKTLHATSQSGGFRSEPIVWDGLDDFGDRIGRGVYVYRLRVQTPDGKSAHKFEKLVMLK